MKAILILLISLFLPAAGRCAGKLSQAELLSRVVIPHFEVIDSPATDFYGFLAGEASQYEPHMVRNTTIVHPNEPKDGHSYHLSEDIADDAIHWLQQPQVGDL